MPIAHCCCVQILLVLLVTPSIGLPADHVPGPLAKRALLIGIDDYKDPGISKLQGAVNDVRLMRELLVGKFDVPPDNILLLENERATRQAILEAIKSHLIGKTDKGDVVIMHFSGHGSQMKDVSGDEIDGWDETLVAYDSRTEGVFDISDDEIHDLLQQIAAKAKNVTFIFDSCHSGAAARGGNSVRMIERDLRDPPPPPPSAAGSRGAEGDADLRPELADYVLISGSMARELSNESWFDGRKHGALTWALANAFKAASARSTFRDVMDDVKAEVNARFPSQHPQIEGPGQDVVIFGTDKIIPTPYVLVTPKDDGNVQIAAGKVFGLSPGTTLKVYPPKTGDFRAIKPMATVTITSVGDFEANAQVTEGGPVQPQSRAILEAITYGEMAIPVYVQPKQWTPLAEVRATLAEMPAISLVADEKDARLIVREQERKITIQSGDLELLVPPIPLAEDEAAKNVTEQIKDIVHWMLVLDLKNLTSGIDIGFDVRRANDEPLGIPAEVMDGTELRYQVENKHKTPLYIYVLDISSDGSVAVLYPYGGQQELPVGQKFERKLRMSVPAGRMAVLDVLKVIATLKPIDPSVFPQGPIKDAPELSPRGDPLERFLANATRARAATDTTVEADSWVTRQKPVRIRRATP